MGVGAYTPGMASNSTQNILDSILDPVGRCLTPDVARKLIDLRADAAAQSRVEHLASKSTAGTLSPDERPGYEAYVNAAAVIAVLPAKARVLLRASATRAT